MSRHRGMKALIEDADDGYDDVNEYEYEEEEDQTQDHQYLYQRGANGTEINVQSAQDYLGPLPPPSPSLTFSSSGSVPTGLSQLSQLPKVGDEVRAKYTADGNWYLAQVTKVTPLGDGHALYRVMYLGYGNEEDLTLEHVRLKKTAAPGPQPRPSRAKAAGKKKGAAAAAAAASAAAENKSKMTKSRSVPRRLGDNKSRGGGKGEEKKKKPRGKNRPKERAAAAFKPTAPSRKQEALRKKLLEGRAGEEAESKAGAKRRVNLVIIGHVDAGKSTLMGHLLVKLGRVDRRTLRKYQKESQQMGKGSFAFAWVLDGHEEERARGITVDVAVSHFETENRRVVLLDAPGHRDFIPNMISGASQADAAILVVPAKAGEFESSFARGGQTKEHATLIRSMGVRHIILAVNKMDLTNWSRDRFEAIRGEVLSYLRTLGYRPSQVSAVPVSGLLGENLVDRKAVDLAHWYDGPTLSGAIDAIPPPPRREDNQKCLCMVVSDIFKSETGGGGFTLAGKIEMGSIIQKDKLLILPNCILGTVKTILSQGQPLKVAKAGDAVEVVLRDVEEDSKNNIHVGNIVCHPHSPLSYSNEFECKVLTLSMTVPLLAGQNIMVYSMGIGHPGYIQELVSQIDRKSGAVVRSKPRCVPQGSAAQLIIKTNQPICLDTFAARPSLGRVSLRRGCETVAFGVVMRIVKVK